MICGISPRRCWPGVRDSCLNKRRFGQVTEGGIHPGQTKQEGSVV